MFVATDDNEDPDTQSFFGGLDAAKVSNFFYYCSVELKSLLGALGLHSIIIWTPCNQDTLCNQDHHRHLVTSLF